MSEVLSQLARLFAQSVPTVIFVFLLFVILERLFFRPVIAVLKQRGEATVGALGRAREQAAAADAKLREYEGAFQAARQEIYRQREAARRAYLSEGEGVLQKAREQAEAMLREAQASLSAEVAGVRKDLDSTCRVLAEEISATILGLPPQPSSGPRTGEAGGPRT